MNKKSQMYSLLWVIRRRKNPKIKITGFQETKTAAARWRLAILTNLQPPATSTNCEKGPSMCREIFPLPFYHITGTNKIIQMYFPKSRSKEWLTAAKGTEIRILLSGSVTLLA